MPNSNNAVKRLGGFFKNLAMAAEGSYFPFPLPNEESYQFDYLEDQLRQIIVTNTSEENYQLRIKNQAPTPKVQKAIKDFASKLEIQFTQQYEISQNTGGNHKARKAAISIFGGIVGGLIPSKLNASGIDLELGEAVKESAEAVNDYLDDAQLRKAQNIIALFTSEDEALRSMRENVLEPFAVKIIRNYEDQIEALKDDSVTKFLDVAIDRIFNVLSQPSNPKFASINSKSNTPIERLNQALLCPTGDKDSLFTRHGVKWNVESMLLKPRIKTVCQNDETGMSVRIDEAVFAHPLFDRNDGKYGERWGEEKEALTLQYQKFDNRRQADKVLTSKLLESPDYQKQKIGKRRQLVIDGENEAMLVKSLAIEDSENLSFYCKTLRKNLKEAFIEKPTDYRNFNLISNDLVQDLTLANAASITAAPTENLVSYYCKIDADAVIKHISLNPTSSIANIVSATRTSPPVTIASTSFDKIKEFMCRSNAGERG